MVIVRGLPQELSLAHPPALESLTSRIQEKVADVLGISRHQVTVFLEQNLIRKDMGRQIIATVEGLWDVYEGSERTKGVRDTVACVIMDELWRFAEYWFKGVCELVEAFVYTLNPQREGFYQKERTEKA